MSSVPFMYIELSYVWYDGKKLGLHWEILQIKHYQNIYFWINANFPTGETRQQIKSIPPPPPPPIVKRSGIPPPPPLIKNNLNEKVYSI